MTVARAVPWPINPVEANEPGFCPYGPTGKLAYWDGHAWSGVRADDAAVTEIPHLRTFLPFLRHLWFWLAASGVLLVYLVNYVSDTNGLKPLAWVSVLGYALVMSAAVLIFTRRVGVRLRRIPRPVLLWGLLSGLIAYGLALGVELSVGPVVDSNPWTNGFSTGVIEEVAKLAVPVALLIWGSNRFSSPRTGLVLAAVSGSVFGFLEGVEYQLRTSSLEATSVSDRVVVELLHPFLTILVAAVIWLAAWRKGRSFTLAGLLALGIAAGIHGFNDGLTFAIANGDSTGGQVSTDLSAIEPALFGGVVWLGIMVLLFLIARVAVRELVPPGLVATSSKGWRPRIHQWGVPRSSSAATPKARDTGPVPD